MNELIKVEERDGIETVNARELHEFLEVGRDFTSWIKQRIEKYEFLEGTDFTTLLTKTGEQVSGSKTIREYHISVDMAKELSMVENNEKGKQARQYFIAREKQARELENRFHIPKTYAEALRLAAEQQEQIDDLSAERRKLQVKAIRDQPKVEFYDQVVASDGAISMEETAKLLGITGFGRNNLFKYLRDKNVLTSKNLPFQKFMDAKWFNVTESSYTTDFGTYINKTTRVYQKGLDGIRRAMKKDGILNAEL